MDKIKLTKWIKEEIRGCAFRGETERENAMSELLTKIDRGYFDEDAPEEEEESNQALRSKIMDTAQEILGDIDHGECFYEPGMLQDFLGNLKKMEHLAKKYYESNRRELAEEDE